MTATSISDITLRTKSFDFIAKVTHKSQIKTAMKDRKVFSVDLFGKNKK